MRQFGKLLLMLWFVMVGAIIAVSIVPIGHPCLKPVVMRYSRTGGTIIDPRTRVTYPEPYVNSAENNGFSPDGKYHSLNSPENNFRFTQIVSTQDNSTILLYESNYWQSSMWSGDSNRIFIYEYFYQSGYSQSHRMFEMDIETGDIIREYAPAPHLRFQSPDYGTLMVTLNDESDDGYQLASINTETGILTEFDTSFSQWNYQWAQDGEWLMLWDVDDEYFSIVNPLTGKRHPLINAPIEGQFSQFTEQSLWFERVVGERNEIWRISLVDGTFHLEHEHGYIHWLSDDDRWAVIGTEYNTIIEQFLYDAVNRTGYHDLNLVRPDFSRDSRCLLSEQINDNSGQLDVVIIDLRNMERIHQVGFASQSYNYYWYESD